MMTMEEVGLLFFLLIAVVFAVVSAREGRRYTEGLARIAELRARYAASWPPARPTIGTRGAWSGRTTTRVSACRGARWASSFATAAPRAGCPRSGRPSGAGARWATGMRRS